MKQNWYETRFYFIGLMVLIFSLVTTKKTLSQCIRVQDPVSGQWTNTPQSYLRCPALLDPIAGTVTINFQTPASNFTVDWGNGDVQTYLGPQATVSYTYPTASLFNFRISFPGCPDSLKGTYVNQRNITAGGVNVPGVGFIVPPAGVSNKRCVPEDLTIINGSPGMNGYTKWLVEWGDQEQDTIGSDFMRSYTHKYLPGTTGCSLQIRVTYLNGCGINPINRPKASYGDYFFKDIDSAAVTPASIILCAPTDVSINDISKLNCLDSVDRQLLWTRTGGFAADLPYPGDNVFRPYNGINRLMNIPTASFFPIPSDSTYRLRMVIRNTCGDDSADATIRIVSPTQPKFAVINNNTCPGEQMNFSNTTSHRPFQSYRVDFGDGTIRNLGFSATFSHTYAIGGAYKVKMWSLVNGYNGQTCGLVDSITVQVKTTISPVITVSPKLGCDTLTVRLENRSKFTTGAVWRGWELGGSPLITAGSAVLPSLINFIQARVISTNLADSSAVVRFNQPGRYIIRLRAQSLGCPEISDYDTVDVYPSPVLRWRIPSKTICLGNSITVRDSSSVIPSGSSNRRGLRSNWNHISWRLQMGDGTVYNSTSNITGNFSDVQGTDRLTSHTYANPGTYWVKLTVQSPDRCPKVDSMRVTVLPAAVPNFKWTRDICSPGLITFMNQTNGASQRYEWIIKRGTVLIAKEVRLAKDTFSYALPYFPPGDSTFYYVTLRAVSGSSPDTCVASTAAILIKIPPSKQAAFSASRLDGCTPVNDVVFVNQSIGIPTDGSHTYTWSFSNGNTFVGENPPLQNYVNNGTSFKRDTVKLAITSNGSCVYRTQKVITIYPVPNPAIVAPAEVCHNTPVTFAVTGNGIGTYDWSFVELDGTNSSLPNPIKTFNNTGTLPIQYNIKLTATTVAGCVDTVVKAIIVNPRPSASFTATPEAACGASPVIFDASSSVAASTYSWNFSDGTSGITDTTEAVVARFFPENTTTIDRSYNISLVTKSDKGCPGPVATKTVRIRPTVISDFVADKKIGCNPLTVNFLNFSSQTDDSYTWYVNELGAPGLGVPSIPNQPNRGFKYTFYNNSYSTVAKFVVTLVVKDDNGNPICEASKSDTITLNPTPLAAFVRDQVSPTTLCSPTSMRIKATGSQGATNYSWTFSDNSPAINATDSLPFFKTLINNGTSILPYTIQLLVKNSFGCEDSVNQNINLRPKVTAAATVDNIIGCSPLASNFVNQSSASSVSFTWYRNGLPVFFNKDIPSQTFLNNSATDTAFYNVFVVARGQGDVCTDTSSSLSIKVLPKPTVISAANPSNGCSPLKVKLNALGTIGGITYSWFVKRTTDLNFTLIQTTNSPNEFEHTLFNSGLTAVNFQIKLVVTGAGSCPDSSISTVTVFPDVLPTFTSSVVSGCSPIRPKFTITSTGPIGTTYVWKVDSIPQFDPTPSEFEYTFAGQSDTSNTQYLVTLQAISSSGCTRDVSTTISVFPKPALDLAIVSSPFVSCSPVFASFFPTVKGPIGTLKWIFDNTDSLVTTKDTAVTRTYVNSGTLPSTQVVKLKLETVNGCKIEVSKSFSVNPGVVAGFSQSANEGCSPLKVNFVNDSSSAGANIFEWYVDGILVGNSAIGINQTFTNGSFSATKVYTIQLVAKNSSSPTCVDTATRFVTVYRKPEVVASGFPLDGCSPLRTSLTASNSQGGVLYQWYRKLNNEVVYQLDTTLNNGNAFDRVFTNTTGSVLTYNLKVVVTGGDGCKDSTIVSVNVSPQMQAKFTVSPDTAGCAPFAVVFGNGTTSPAANSYQWIVDGVGVSNSPAFLSYSFDNTSNTDAKVYNVQLVASNLTFGCPDTTVQNITVWPKPLVNQVVTMDPSTGCSPVNVGFQPINFAGVSTFFWYLPDTVVTTLDTVITRSFVNNTVLPQTRWVTLKAFNNFGCSAEKTSNFQVNPRVEASFTASRDSVCSPAEITFSNTSSPGVNVAEWYVNGVFKGNSLSGITDLFENNDSIPKQFTIRLVVRNSITTACEDTASRVITVFPKPLAGNIFASVENGCSPLHVDFSGSAQFANRYIWDFGDGTIIDTNTQQSSHTFYNLNSTINAQVTIWQVAINQYGCADSTFTIVNVRPNVTAGIIASDSVGCSPLSVSFSGAASVNANSYSWDFGSGSTATGSSVSRIFTNNSDTARTFRIRLIADRAGIGCPDTAFVSVKVNPKPISDFDVSPNAGCQPLKVSFTNNSALAVSGYWVITGGPSIDTIQGLAGFDSIFSNNTSLNQIVKAELFVSSDKGCVAQSSKLITVSPFVNADFVQSADSGCTPLAVNFTNLSAPGSSASWFVDDVLVNNAATQFNYSFVNSTQDVKIFEVKLLVASVLNVGCLDTAVKFVKVFPKPVAGVLGAVPDNGCSPILISLFSNALGATRYQFDFNDGSVLDTNVATVSHSFVNNASLITRSFDVKLLVSNAYGCSDNTSKLVSVKPTVKAVINSPDTLGCTPYSVGLSGLNSVNSNLYTWDFGDGTNSSLATPVKVYNNLSDTIQNYTVQLVTDRSGINCPDTTTFKLVVYPKPVADFVPNPTLGCNPLPVSITNLTSGYTSATYTFSGNGQTVNIPATAANFDTIFVNDQSNLNLNVDMSLTAINQLGCSDTKTRSVTIYPDVKAAFNQTAFTGCAPLKVRLTNQSNAGNLVKWLVDGQLVSSTMGTLNYTFDNTGFTNKIYKVQLIASSALAPQCTDTASSIIFVYPKPDAGILTAIPEVACSPANIDFVGSALGATQFNWNFGDGAEFDSSSQSLGHVFYNNNSFNNRIFRVRLIAKNSDGCTDTTFKNVTVRPLVGAQILSNDSLGCTPFSASFSGSQSSNANQYEWDFGGLGTSTLVNPNFIFVNSSDSMECHTVRLVTRKAGIECSDTAYFRVCVNPRPTPDFSINPTSGCQPLAVSFINQSQLADSSVWVLNSNGFQTETTALNFDTIIENVSSQIKNVRVTLFTYTNNGCVNSIEKQFNVSPLVQAGFVQNLDSNCSPLRVRFTNQSAAGNLVNWYVDGQLVSTLLNNFSYSFVNNGFTNKTFEVKLIARSSLDPNCTDTAVSTVTVYPKPNAGVINALPEIACSPAKIDFVGTSVGATQFNWNFGDATELDTTTQEVSHVFSNTNSINNRVFKVRLIVSNSQGCTDSAYKNVTIRPLVRAAILSNDSLGCTPYQAAFVGSQSTNASQYFWDFGGLGSSTLMNPVFTFVNNTDTTECHTVRLITQKSGVECADTAYFKVCVYPRPTTEFNINPVSGCQPLAVNLTNQSQLADSSVWVFNSNGFQTSISSQNFDTIVGNNTAQIKTVNVTLFAYTDKGCVNSKVKQFTVSPFVKADFSQSLDSGCSPLPVSFVNLSSTGSSAAWYVDGTQVSSSNGSFNFTFVNNSTQIREVEVKLIVRNNLASSCTDTITKKIYVFPKPEIGVISASPESGCSPLLSQLSATPNIGSRFIWDFKDGTTLDSNLLTVSHEFVSFNPSSNLPFNVRLIAMTDKGCTDTASKTLLVSPFTIARIGIADSVGCSPLTLQLAGALSQNANRFSWDFGDGSNSSLVANPVKTFTNNTQVEAVYNVRLIASRSGFSCPDTAYKTIRVFANPKASFSANVYSGCGPLPVQFVNNAELADSMMYVISSLAGVDTLFTTAANWDTTFSNPFAQQMNVRVEQHVWTNSGCYNSMVRNILVNPDVKPLFTVSGNGCSPHKVQFTNLSTNPGGAYQWTFGDGTPASTAFSPSHLFIHNGGKDTTFTVSMLAISNPVFSPACNQTFTFPVKVFAKPVPDFSISPQILVLPQTSASFTNLTPNRTNWKYKWTFGDNTKDTANGLVVEHNYASIVTELSNTSVNIKMLAYSPNGCKDSVSKTLEIRPVKPVVSFEPDTSGCAPLLVSFKNKSKYGSQYLWTFGDGTTSTEQNPSKRYEQAGEYSVSLRVTGPGGEETLKRNNIIQVFENPDAGFTTVPKAPRALKIPEEKMNCFVRYPQPGWTYEWNFGDGNISREKDPVHAYKEPGSFNVTLTVTSAEGCVDRDTLTNGAIVEKGNIVIVPNAFTPRKEGSTGGYLDKEDGTNDVFYPLTEGVTEIRLQIFNRWGQFLYESTTLNKGWDGTFEGNNCKSDVYVYKVWCRFVDGRTETRVGDLTLLR